MWLNASRLLVVATFFLFLSCSASAYVDNGEKDPELVHESSRLSGVSSPKEDIVPLLAKNAAVRQEISSVSDSHRLDVRRKRLSADTKLTAASPTAVHAARRLEMVASTVLFAERGRM